MAEMQESSVLFSLKQLMSLEEERQHEEETALMRRTDALAAARADTERRARADEEARIQAVEARRRAEEQQRREENARIAAMTAAQIEGARIDAERRARIAILEQEQEHARKLAMLDGDQQKKRLLRVLVGGGVLAFTLIASGAAAYFGHMKPEAERARAGELSAVADREREVAALRADYDRATAREKAAQADLASARDAAEIAKARQAVAEAKKDEGDARKRLAHRPAGTKKVDAPPCKCLDPGDPGCACLD